MKKLFCLLALTALVSSCSYLDSFKSPKLMAEPDYVNGALKLDIKKFFNGDIEAFAVTRDKNGNILSTQVVKINGKWEGNKGVIQQDYLYNDGSKDSRTWLVTVNADGSFDAVGHNVSTMAQGKQTGNTAEMIYALTLLDKDVRREIKYEDKMYLVDEKSMIMVSNFKNKNSESGTIIISLKKI